MKRNVKITYVKVGDEIEIHYEERHDKGMGTIKFTSEDKPRKSFTDAFLALKEHVIDMCECPESWTEEIEVNSLSLNYKGERKTMGAVITATRKLLHSKTPLNLFTPHKTINESGAPLKGDGRLFLTPQCVTAIGVITGEAKLFLQGARINDDQMEIFNEFDNPDVEGSDQIDIEDELDNETDTPMKRGVSPETEKVFGMEKVIPNDANPATRKRIRTSDKYPAHESGLDVKKVKKNPHKK